MYDVYEPELPKANPEVVSRYAKEDMRYPCFVIGAEPPVELVKFKVLKSMNGMGGDIAVYYKDGDRMAVMGRIAPSQVKSFLRLFEGRTVTGYYDDKTELTGGARYVLSGVSV